MEKMEIDVETSRYNFKVFTTLIKELGAIHYTDSQRIKGAKGNMFDCHFSMKIFHRSRKVLDELRQRSTAIFLQKDLTSDGDDISSMANFNL